MAEFTARGGETLCFLAVEFGYADCRPLRAANAHLQNRETLETGDRVTIPEVTRRVESGQTETLHKFRRPLTDQPQIQFVFEEGRAYGQNLPAATGSGPPQSPNQPQLDRRLGELNLSNYVVNRSGDGLDPGTFPSPNFFNFDAEASRDPDHFKVQVRAPRLPASQRQVKVKLFAMRPVYFKGQNAAGRDIVTQHPTRFVRPQGDARTLEVTCERVGSTPFFRSPYLRLVSSQGSKDGRPFQALLVSDYFTEGPQTYKKHYVEILHQRVQARGRLRMCPVPRCAVRTTVPIGAGSTVHLAIHVLRDTVDATSGNLTTSVTLELIRSRVYEWARRVLAPAHIRPVIEQIHEVDVPGNMLAIANDTGFASRGMRASGRTATGGASQMRFMVETQTLTLNIGRAHRNDTPEQTADRIIALIQANRQLAGFTARKFRCPLTDPQRADAARSDPFDLLIFRADGTPAFVDSLGSSDRPNGGLGGQTLTHAPALTAPDPAGRPFEVFPVGATSSISTPGQRLLRHSFDVPNCLNIYVFGARIMPPPGPEVFEGWSPHGNFHGTITDVGPCVYLAENGVTNRPLCLAHEICHPLMHVFHAKSPRKPLPPLPAPPPPAVPPVDTRPNVTELMGERADDVDSFEMSKHISDAPIAAFYDIPEEPAGFSLLDGTIPLQPDSQPSTPVRRFHQVGGQYGIVRANGEVPHDATAAPDLPVDQAAAEAQADADDRAAAGP